MARMLEEAALGRTEIVQELRAEIRLLARQTELGREFPVALVLGGHGHDRPRAIAHQHVISNPDRNGLLG